MLTLFYLSLAFIQIPPFRNSFIQIINKSINLKDENYLQFSSHNFLNFAKNDETNKFSNNNFMLWDTLFYQKLDSSINLFISVLFLFKTSKLCKQVSNVT